MRLIAITSLLLSLLLGSHPAVAQSLIPPARDSVYRQFLDFGSLVKGGSLVPHWMADGRSFWYVEGAPARATVLKVDPATNTVAPLLDASRLRAALAPVLGHEPPYEGLPFETFQFLDGETAISFELEERAFRLDLDSYRVTALEGLPTSGPPPPPPSQPPSPEIQELPAPRGPWTAVAKDHNLSLRSSNDGRLVPLTDGGVERFPWTLGSAFRSQAALWSPDGTRLLAFKADRRNIHFMPVVHWLKPNREEITWQPYAAVGEPLPETQLHVIDATSGVPTQLDVADDTDQAVFPLGWRPDRSEILMLRTDRLQKQLDMVAVDPASGTSRVLFTERQSTFIEGLAFNPQNLFFPFSDGSRFVWRSERDGWSQLYMYDAEGTLLRQLTMGETPVDNVRRLVDYVHERTTVNTALSV